MLQFLRDSRALPQDPDFCGGITVFSGAHNSRRRVSCFTPGTGFLQADAIKKLASPNEETGKNCSCRRTHTQEQPPKTAKLTAIKKPRFNRKLKITHEETTMTNRDATPADVINQFTRRQGMAINRDGYQKQNLATANKQVHH